MSRKRVRGQCDDCGVDLSSPSKRCRPCNTKARQPAVSAKERQAAWHREKKYGMVDDEFEFYWQAQYGCCKICSITMRRPLSQRGQPLDVVDKHFEHYAAFDLDENCVKTTRAQEDYRELEISRLFA